MLLARAPPFTIQEGGPQNNIKGLIKRSCAWDDKRGAKQNTDQPPCESYSVQSKPQEPPTATFDIFTNRLEAESCVTPQLGAASAPHLFPRKTGAPRRCLCCRRLLQPKPKTATQRERTQQQADPTAGVLPDPEIDLPVSGRKYK